MVGFTGEVVKSLISYRTKTEPLASGCILLVDEPATNTSVTNKTLVPDVSNYQGRIGGSGTTCAYRYQLSRDHVIDSYLG